MAIEGTPVVDGYQAAAVSFTCNLPTGVVSGELLVINAICGDRLKRLEVTGWSTLQVSHSTFARNYIWKEADGTEGGTSVTVNVLDSGTADAHLTSFRMSGIDTTDPFNSGNTYGETLASTATPTIPASSLTITAGRGILAGIACEADRSVTIFDADLDVEVVMSNGSISNHVYLDLAEAGTANPQYDFTTSSARAYDVDLVELNLPAHRVTATTGGLTLAAFDATITATVATNVVATVASLTITGFDAIQRQSEAANLAFNGSCWPVPTWGENVWPVAGAHKVIADTGSLSLASFDATITALSDTNIIGINAGTVTLTPFPATIGRSNTSKIDGQDSLVILTNYQSKTLYCNGSSGWFTID